MCWRLIEVSGTLTVLIPFMLSFKVVVHVEIKSFNQLSKEKLDIGLGSLSSSNKYMHSDTKRKIKLL